MDRSTLLALLRLDAGENIFHSYEYDCLMKMGYIDDDGCECFITAKGDALINRACNLGD